MSHFNCDKCGVIQVDSRHGYIAGCHHYPPDFPFTVLLKFDETGERDAYGFFEDGGFYLTQVGKELGLVVNPIRWIRPAVSSMEGEE